MADRCASSFDTNTVGCEEAFLRKNILNQSIAALRRSVGLLADLLLYEKIEPDTHEQTHTPNYCNSSAHAR